MKMVIGRKSKKNNIKPKQYKKSKRYGKSKRYNKTQRGGGRWDDLKNKLNSLKERGQAAKERVQQALNAKKDAIEEFIKDNQSNINVETTKAKILGKLNASKTKIEALMSKLENNNENINDIVKTDGAEEFIDPEDIALNEGPNEGPNEE